MVRVRFLFLLLLAVVAASCTGTGPGQEARNLPDTPENRAVAAKRYLEAMPPKEMLQGVANRIVPSLPEKERKPFMAVMNSETVEQAAYRITLDSLVKNFTVGELNAMVAFYGSPEGQSAYRKFDVHMRETIPRIQQEVKKALEVAAKQPEGGGVTEPKGQAQEPESTEPKTPASKNK